MAEDYIKRNDLFVLAIDYSGYGEWEEAVPVRVIRNIPSADVAEVKHGEWKWRNGGECSECGFHNSNFDYNFCPNCGARMDMEETDASQES